MTARKQKRPALVLHRKSANRPEIKAALATLKEEGISIRVFVPWNKKAKGRVVRDLIREGYRRIIAGGGDGTLNAVADAIVRRQAPDDRVAMGILPLGTANDLAHGLGLPCDDLVACLRLAATQPARGMDVGVMNGRHFVNVASGGFGAEVTATTPQDVKRRLGGAAYTLNGLIKVWGLRPYTGTLHVPGREPERGAMLLMAVGNNPLAGGGFEVAPGADPADGKLDLVVINERALAEPRALLAEVKNVDAPDNEIVRHERLEAFRIEADEPLHINLDGEPVVSDQFDFSVLPLGLDMVY